MVKIIWLWRNVANGKTNLVNTGIQLYLMYYYNVRLSSYMRSLIQ